MKSHLQLFTLHFFFHSSFFTCSSYNPGQEHLMHVMAKFRLIIAAAAIGMVGCAAGPSDPPAPATRPVQLADTSPAKPDAKAVLPLDEIEPHLAMPPGKGTSVGHPPLEAVHLYAQAYAAQVNRDRGSAIELYQKALELDPLSYDLHVRLAHLYLAPAAGFSNRSLELLEKAAALEPDHLDLQIDLARQYLAKGNRLAAMLHFRLALLTRQYKANAPASAAAEYSLARMLRNDGYYAAALELNQRLAAHVRSAGMSLRAVPEVAPLLDRAEAIDAEIAELQVLAGRLTDAVASYSEQVEKYPGNFELRSKQVHLLLTQGQHEQAVTAAESAAVHFRANTASVELLNEACVAAGHTDGAVGALTRGC
jgi:tetratricopeptide (TPR) repeat protein